MIGALKGLVFDKSMSVVEVNCQGVIYEVQVPVPVANDAPAAGQEICLHTHLAINDDAHRLFGFQSRADRDLFRQLIKINGVGPKVAIAIMSTLEGPDLAQCVREKDTKTLTKVPGIGKKGAEKIIVDLDGKLESLGFAYLVAGAKPAAENNAPGLEDATKALVSLGYKAADAEKIVKEICEPGMSTGEMVRAALKRATKK